MSRVVGCAVAGAVLAASSAGAAVFSVRPLDVMLELRYEALADTTQNAQGERIFELRSSQFIPRVLVQTGVVLFDPRIATIELGVGLRSSRGSVERLDRPQPDASEDDLRSYNVSLALLPSNRFSLTASSRRTQDYLQLPFVAATELRLDETTWVLGMGRMALPGTLVVQSSEARERVSGAAAAALWRQEDTISYSGFRRWDLSSLRIAGRQLDQRNRLANSTASKSQNLSADFDTDGLRPWLEQTRSQLAVFRRLGNAAAESVSLAGAVGLRHGPRLGSSFSASLRRDDGLGGREPQDQVSLAGSLRHRLYRSLRSSVRIAAARTQADGGNSSRDGVDAEIQYSKSLPLNGQLRLQWNQGLENRDVAARSGQLRVVAEPHTARVGLSFALDQPNAIAGTLIVTSDGGGTIYLEGSDWVADFVGIRTEIRVLAGGTIVDGQPLLVSYRVILPDRLQNRLTRQGAGAELRLGVASVYYRRNSSNDRSEIEVPLRFSANQRHEEGGATMSLAMGAWSLNGRVLEQRFDSPLTAFDQVARSATVGFAPGGRFNFFAQHELADTEFERPLRAQVQELTAVGIGMTPGGRLSLTARLDRRRLDDSLLGEEEHDSAALNFQWTFGKLSFAGFVGRNEGRRGANETRSNRAFFSVLRRF
jgi:hypothetical protein